MLEADVHHQLREFLREKQQTPWRHHLTMARLVSRTLRLHRSALIQTGCLSPHYSYSYLTPALLSEQAMILVAAKDLQNRLFNQEIPQLQRWLGTNKPILLDQEDFSPTTFSGLLLISPEHWLSDRLFSPHPRFLAYPTLIDQAEYLPEWTKACLTFRLTFQDWTLLRAIQSPISHDIREIQVKLTKSLFSHPPNPYDCYLLDENDLILLESLQKIVIGNNHDIPFFQEWQHPNRLYWAEIDRQKGSFILQSSPLEVASYLTPLWQQQPIVLIGSFLGVDKEAKGYQTLLGLNQQALLCLQFSPHRQNEYIYLYLPDKLPLPNTAEFQGILQTHLQDLIQDSQETTKPIVILVEDLPLQAQIGAYLAAQWGSRVQVNRLSGENNLILVCHWEFWYQNADHLPRPQLLIITTLPIPSLENPLVAGQVAYYKQKRQDWFRSYLLPTTLSHLQRAIMPLRETQGWVVILDNRVNSRSYGSTILTALEPYIKLKICFNPLD